MNPIKNPNPHHQFPQFHPQIQISMENSNPHHHKQEEIQQFQPPIEEETYSLPSISGIVVFEDEDEEEDKPVDSSSPSSSDADIATTNSASIPPNNSQSPVFINPEPHISSQFYTFNKESHALMVRCIVEGRLATPDEIRRATPRGVLKSWRSVWKDRNEDTAYLTAWKRIQDKLNAHVDPHGNQVLYFKNNSQQYVSYTDQWQDIVMSYHGDADLKHLGLKESIERIKQVWTVGAKFYGIPESFIRACVGSCPVCNDASCSATKSKRRRFEYTESFDVPAKEVPQRLQQLAAKHKVVLCIRQKYIRYKPFMAEVKDYACHRAGEPVAKKSKILKREPYASKRCGCGFRIRAIVPIANYNEKDKTFVYQDEGMAVFKLYAVHTGHQPGPLDGNARIIHRVVGHKGGGFLMDQDTIYGMSDEMETDTFGFMGKDDGDMQFPVLHQMQELKVEVGLLEEKLVKMPRDFLGSLSRELLDIVNRVRSIGDEASRTVSMLQTKQHSDEVLVGENDLANWGNDQHDQMYGDGKGTELIEEDDDSFEQTLVDVLPWDRMGTECRSRKILMSENLKSDKWLKDPCDEFDEKSILDCEEDSKLIKPLRHDTSIVTDAALVGIQVDSFYPDNTKWYDSPCGLDPGADCGNNGFRHGEIV
ncbi:hypothetical protein ACHQM5_001123 [Ranunculus cassubicifolius]